MIALAAALTLQQAVAAFEAGRLGEAQAAFAELARSDPRDAGALAWQAAAAMENEGDLAAAERLLEASLRIDGGKNWRAHMLLGVALAKRIEQESIFGKISLAGRIKDELEKAVELAPGSADARLALMQFDLHAPRIAGGGEAKAREQAAAIARIDPFAGALARAQIEESAAGLLAAARTDGERVKALLEMARREDDPRPSLARAAALQPDNPLLRALLGEAQLSAGDLRGASASAQAALGLDPALGPAQRLAARIARLAGQGS